ncbi:MULTISPECIES: cytochrome P450 [unclassified Streptomyces]|uniref:cytochrome P450 n=1 Tax=unclassified Streptomyces TaxID=2593676 RepID=UPI002DD98957|nr:cytochrome P450 [Streptomyces sp. NBC_01257]WRZ63525.1 cytochrome P450 [Streptomyces sp. NBC_01257]WSU57490.1 cytochrome P450 [Streptomyces sp. NBC_01104]
MSDLVDACPHAQPRPFPLERTGCPLDPAPEYAVLRETEPVSRVKLKFNGREAWLLTRYEDVRQMLVDPRFSSNMADPGYPLQFHFPMELLGKVKPALLHMDPPEHTAHRMMLMPELSVKRVEAMRPRTQEIVDECIDAMLDQGGPVDLVSMLSMPVPSIGMCELTGVPHESRDLFHRWVTLLVTQGSAEEHASANAEVEVLLYELIAERQKNPGDDLISSLLQRNDQKKELEPSDISALVRAMIAAGHESTVNGITIGALVLLQHPEQADWLRAHPELSGQAVDELSRYSSISDHGTVRVALEDAEIGGQLIRKGEGVICSLSASNHDPAVFKDPNTLDLTRREARHNVAFGFGRHQCAGQMLVRMQLEVVFTTLLRRIPGLRLDAALNELPFKANALIDGVHELPVTW